MSWVRVFFNLLHLSGFTQTGIFVNLHQFTVITCIHGELVTHTGISLVHTSKPSERLIGVGDSSPINVAMIRKLYLPTSASAVNDIWGVLVVNQLSRTASSEKGCFTFGSLIKSLFHVAKSQAVCRPCEAL